MQYKFVAARHAALQALVDAQERGSKRTETPGGLNSLHMAELAVTMEDFRVSQL